MTYCHPDFGCDCGDRIAELEAAVVAGDKAVSAVHDVVHALISPEGGRRELDQAIWLAHDALRPAVPAARLGERPQGFSEPSVAAERLAAGVPLPSRHEGGDDG